MDAITVFGVIVAALAVLWRGIEMNRREAPMTDDVCGFCGRSGTDKVPHPVRWPGEDLAGTEYVHAACEEAECARAHQALSDEQREAFLRTV